MLFLQMKIGYKISAILVGGAATAIMSDIYLFIISFFASDRNILLWDFTVLAYIFFFVAYFFYGSILSLILIFINSISLFALFTILISLFASKTAILDIFAAYFRSDNSIPHFYFENIFFICANFVIFSLTSTLVWCLKAKFSNIE